jgi:hypothetical protein
MKNPLNNLNEVLNSPAYSEDLPLALPPVHVSIARWFDSIVSEGKIEPRMCSIFGEKLLYLFYGGVFYRPSNKPTKNASELPIAFVFNPNILDLINRYYPFDTGAVGKELFGEWTKRLEHFKEEFKVQGGDYKIPCKIVRCLYGTNTKYLEGRIDPEFKKAPPPLPLLFEFMSQDFTPMGIDHRQYIIECQLKSALNLDHQLLWVGFPECMTNEFTNLLKRTLPYIPDYYSYPSHAVFNPSDIAAQLQTRAYDIIRRFEKLPSID